MKNEEKKNSKVKISTIVAIIVLSLMAICAIFLVEEVIRSFILQNESIFMKNYVKNLIYLTISAIIYLILFTLEEKNKLFCKEWLKISIILYVFITLNVCNFFNWYTYRVVKYLVFAINGAFFAIFGVSIDYNYLKNENNKVKARAIMVSIFSIALAIVFALVTEFIFYLVDLISKSEPTLFINALYDILFSLAGAFIINIFFYLSLTKSKKFINYCLIDIQK